ncbi:protein phosphatase 2C domain-containing protein [Arsenicicoccus piscis]|uniref:PPM-type phosphatase domain-containing protein n=1 Tax=Arsenicicoccus piscis TaxID=673954 RepID=A0ABQ6HNH1_9MICO|nr:protein phosphatase 2C domain-containing protein [Arsenicicoccus piscis]MCH8629007.1 protein phosphatase 2C domain-containing protein [Arsenicicoccus piscis]GMA19623.1 hypothetical protein GCM10025862_16440 [Arsenicicoccus piscis]
MTTSTGSRYAAHTDIGRVSAQNEDSFAVGDFYWMVADGMGGHQAGEVASRLAVEAAVNRVERGPHPGQSLVELVESAFSDALDLLQRAADGDEVTSDMGTTLILAVQEDDEVVIGHVGDSRAYVLGARGGDGGGHDRGDHQALTQVTRDHNVAEEMLALGMITAAEAQHHPGQYQLTRALTGTGAADTTVTLTRLPATGRLLLCSDGLNGELTDDEIAEWLGTGTPAEAARSLVELALDKGGRDNITVVVVDLGVSG